MKRIKLREVPDDVHSALVAAAAADRQSLSAYVVDRLTEVAQLARSGEYVESYEPPMGSGISLEDAVAAVRASHDAS